MNGKARVAGLVTAVGLGLSLGGVLGEDSGSSFRRRGRSAAPAATVRTPRVVFAAREVAAPQAAAVDAQRVGEVSATAQVASTAASGPGGPLTAADLLYDRLQALQSSGQLPAKAELDALLARAFEAHDDWELQELAFAVFRQADPEAHRVRLLALAGESTSPVGQLAGALASAEGLEPQDQDRVLEGVARAQSAAIAGLPVDAELEAVQRRDLAECAANALVQRLPPSALIEWLLAARGTERRVLARALDEQERLAGPQGLSVVDARLLCDLLLEEGQAREDLSGWGPELELAARLPADARDRAGWKALLGRARASQDGVVSSAAEELLAMTVASAR